MMDQRFFCLGIEHFKRLFYKKTSLMALIGTAFLLSYSITLFIILKSDVNMEFSANEFILFFLGNFNISGVFLNTIFILFISGMFEDNINYMYISRLKNEKDFMKSFILGLILASIFFVVFIFILIIIIGFFLGRYSYSWSEGMLFLAESSPSIDTLTRVCDPISSIIISIWLLMMGLFIISIIFYLGFCRFKGISGGIFINITLIGIGGIVYNTKSLWMAKIIPSINTIFTTHSLHKGGEYPSFVYSVIYIFITLLLLCLLSAKESKKYLNGYL